MQEVLAPLGVVNFRTPQKSAKDLLNASFEEEPLASIRKLFILTVVQKWNLVPKREARDETKQNQLWIESVKLSSLKEDETVLNLSF